MLISFSVENYRSIKEKKIFTFACAKNTDSPTGTYDFGGDRFNLISAVFGANASGKSTLLMAFQFVKTLIMSNGPTLPGQGIAVPRFKMCTLNGTPAKFQILFVKNHIKYFYEFWVKPEGIVYEILKYAPKGHFVLVFERKSNQEYDFGVDEATLSPLVSKTLPTRLFLTTAASWNFVVAQEAVVFFTHDVIIDSRHTLYLSEPGLHDVNEFTRKILADPKLTDFVLRFIRIADPSISSLQIKQSTALAFPVLGSDGVYRLLPPKDDLVFIHVCDGKQYPLHDFEESVGTMSLIALSCYLYEVLKEQRILMIDEFDSSLHPLICRAIVDTFLSKAPENGSQLLFTTHDLSLLSLEIFRRDQIWFAERCQDGGSDYFSLADIGGVRVSDKIARDYLSGRYGAIPSVKGLADL